MRIGAVPEVIRAHEAAGNAVMMWAPPGVGKSAVVGQMCEDDPAHLKACKRLLSELRKQKNHSEWLKRMFAEVGETLLTRAIRWGADAEDDHAIEPDDDDEDLSPPGAPEKDDEKGKGGEKGKGKPEPKGKGDKEKTEAAFKAFLASKGRADLL